MKSKDKEAHVIWKYNDEVVYDSAKANIYMMTHV